MHAWIQKVLSGGPIFFFFFFFFTFFSLMRGERIEIELKAGQDRPSSEMVFRWQADDGPILNAGLVAL